jgi:hypothetical protein
LVDPTLSAVVEKSAGSKDPQHDVEPHRGSSQAALDVHPHMFEDSDGDGDGDGDDDHLREMLRGDSVPSPSSWAHFMEMRGGGPSSRSPAFAFGGGGRAGAPHSVSVSSGFSLAANQEIIQTLLIDLRELLLPFATSAVSLQGTEQFDGISQTLTAAATGQLAPEDLDVIAALSKLKELALRGALSDTLDSPEGLRLIKALGAFMSDLPETAGPIHAVLRREMFRSQFCFVAEVADDKVTRILRPEFSGLKALLQQVLSLFDENHSEILSLFDQESEMPSSFRAQSSSAAGVFEVQLRPMPNDSGCQKHFGCASTSFSHNSSSNFRDVAGKITIEISNHGLFGFSDLFAR